MDVELIATADPGTTPETAPASPSLPAVPTQRMPFLEELLDEHLRGGRRWAFVERVLKLADGDAPLSRAEIAAAAGAADCGHVVDMLVQRGLLVEVLKARRLVLRRPGR